MPKVAPDAMIDASLNYVGGSTAMHACSTLDATPTRAEVIAASLADVVMAGGDFVVADGDVSGRKVTVAAKSGVTVDATGTANHVAVVDATNVRYVTTCSPQALTAANTVNFPAWKVEIADPT